MKTDYFKRLSQSSIQPKERARNCPNCGELYWDSELNYSSTKRIDCDNGSFASKLYGVCSKCAERHSSFQ